MGTVVPIYCEGGVSETERPSDAEIDVVRLSKVMLFCAEGLLAVTFPENKTPVIIWKRFPRRQINTMGENVVIDRTTVFVVIFTLSKFPKED